MSKFQKLSQINKDIELLENAGKLVEADILHKKFIREAQYVMPQMMPMMMPQMMMPQMMMARPTMPVAPAAVPRPVAPVAQPAPVAAPAPKPAPAPIGETPKPGTTPVQTIGTPNPGGSPAPTPAPTPKPSPGNMKTAPTEGVPTEGGNYNMIPGPGGKVIFTDPVTGNPVDPPGAYEQFDYYYGKIQEAYRLPEPQRSKMLKNLMDQINQRKNKLGDRLHGSLRDIFI